MAKCKYCESELDLTNTNSRYVRCKSCKRSQYLNNEMLLDTSVKPEKKLPEKEEFAEQKTVVIQPARYVEKYSPQMQPQSQAKTHKESGNGSLIVLTIIGIIGVIAYFYFTNTTIKSAIDGIVNRIVGRRVNILDNDEDSNDSARTDFTLMSTSANEGVSVIDTDDPRIFRSELK